jgi:hypothetical protein
MMTLLSRSFAAMAAHRRHLLTQTAPKMTFAVMLSAFGGDYFIGAWARNRLDLRLFQAKTQSMPSGIS